MTSRARVIPVYVNYISHTVRVLHDYVPYSIQRNRGITGAAKARAYALYVKYEGSRDAFRHGELHKSCKKALTILNKNFAEIDAKAGDIVYVMYLAEDRNIGLYVCNMEETAFIPLDASYEDDNLPREIQVTARPHFHVNYWKDIIVDNTFVWAKFAPEEAALVTDACSKVSKTETPFIHVPVGRWNVIVTFFTADYPAFAHSDLAMFVGYPSALEDTFYRMCRVAPICECLKHKRDPTYLCSKVKPMWASFKAFISELHVPLETILVRTGPLYSSYGAILCDPDDVEKEETACEHVHDYDDEDDGEDEDDEDDDDAAEEAATNA